MPKKIIPSANRSLVNLKADAKNNSKAFNDMWGVAKKAQFLLRPQKMDPNNPKKPATHTNMHGKTVVVPQRMNRAMRKHPMKVLVSAAAAQAAKILSEDGANVRVDQFGENSIGAMPRVSEGAQLEFERFLISYSQTVFEKALAIRDSMGMHSKVTEGCMSAACKITNSEIVAAGGVAPGTLVIEKSTKRSKKKAQEEQGTEGAEAAVPSEA